MIVGAGFILYFILFYFVLFNNGNFIITCGNVLLNLT